MRRERSREKEEAGLLKSKNSGKEEEKSEKGRKGGEGEKISW